MENLDAARARAGARCRACGRSAGGSTTCCACPARKAGPCPCTRHRIADALTRRLGTLGVERPAVDVTVVAEIERTAAGKLRIVVPDRLPEAPVA
jgi:hypothetical protein